MNIQIDADTSRAEAALLNFHRDLVRYDLGIPELSDEIVDMFIAAMDRRHLIRFGGNRYGKPDPFGFFYIWLEDKLTWLWYGCSWKERLLKKALSNLS